MDEERERDEGGPGEHVGDLLEGGARDIPQRGSAEPTTGDADPAGARRAAERLDPDLLEEGGGALPRVDALDTADPGAPVESPGTMAGPGAGAGARSEGTGGAGVKAAKLRDRAHDLRRGDDQAAGGGPPKGLPGTPGED